MNILFISIAFPPKNNPECLQTGKYFNYLSKNKNYKITVLTSSSPTLFMPKDPSLENNLDQSKMVELSIPENKYVNYIIRKIIPTFLQLPDSKFLFHLQWKKAIKRINQRPDIIYSRSFPLSSSIMALRLAKFYKVPWILHLSDPWVDNPLEKRTHKAISKNQKWEKECFDLASVITLTSIKALSFYKSKYPYLSEKFQLMPNVYDPSDINTKGLDDFKSQQLQFVYTGGLTEERTPEPLFQALEILEKRNPSIMKKVNFSFAGQFDRRNKALFQKYNFSCVRDLGLLNYRDAVNLQQSANVLLVIDSPALNEDKALFFPSKLLDYIASQKRILAITDVNSTTYEVVENKYGTCFVHKDVSGLANEIEKYVKLFEEGRYAYFKNELADDQYSASYNAERLGFLMDSIVRPNI